MAVYTPLEKTEIQAHLHAYDLGELRHAEGIAEGIENSNFLITTTKGRYILTLFEKRVKEDDLPYFMALMLHLEEKGVHCPRPIPAQNGDVVLHLKERPAVIISFMEGHGVEAIGNEYLALLGNISAQMHLAAEDFSPVRANSMALGQWSEIAEKVKGKTSDISPKLDKLLSDELDYIKQNWPQDLPSGPVHADLFPDNVFFLHDPEGELQLSGVIDFYFACNECWMYDLAITLNAWCFDEAMRFQPERAETFFAAYQEVRKITEDEKAALPVLARAAALRFLLTRVHDMVFHPPEALVTPKDPREYIEKLSYFRDALGWEKPLL